MVLPKKPATFSSAQFAKALASPPGTPAGSPSLDDAFYLDFVDNKTVDIRSPAEMKVCNSPEEACFIALMPQLCCILS